MSRTNMHPYGSPDDHPQPHHHHPHHSGALHRSGVSLADELHVLRLRRATATLDAMEVVRPEHREHGHTVGPASVDYMHGDGRTPYGNVEENAFYYASADNIAHAHEREAQRFQRLLSANAINQPTRVPRLGVTAVEKPAAAADAEEAAAQQQWLIRMLELQTQLIEAMTDDPFDFPPIPPPYKANCMPVGLVGFGMTMVLHSLGHTGHYPMCTLTCALCIAFGGLMQFIAGVLAIIHRNIFCYVTFLSYACYNFMWALLWLLPNTTNSPTTGLMAIPTNYTIGCLLLPWSLYTAGLFFCTFRMNIAAVVFYGLLLTRLLLLTGGYMGDHLGAVQASGYVGVVCGAAALYLAFAQFINDSYQRCILPVGHLTTIVNYLGKAEGAGEESLDSYDRRTMSTAAADEDEAVMEAEHLSSHSPKQV